MGEARIVFRLSVPRAAIHRRGAEFTRREEARMAFNPLRFLRYSCAPLR